MELEITWNRIVKIWWAYLWRNLIAIIASMIAGGILGAIVGFVLGLIGMSMSVIQICSGIVGGCAGLAFSVIPFKYILGKDFGEFRLVLVESSSQKSI